MKKNVGTRTAPIVRTPEQARKHRAEQAARAILAGRNVGTNWARIARHLIDGEAVTEYAEMAIPPETLAWLTPVWSARDLPPTPTPAEQYVETASDACAETAA